MSVDVSDLNKLFNLIRMPHSTCSLRRMQMWNQFFQTQYVAGDLVEIGCYEGGTSVFWGYLKSIICPNKQFHVYDGFVGLKGQKEIDGPDPLVTEGNFPTTIERYKKNFEAYDVDLPIIHQITVQDLKPEDLPEKISLSFVDLDLYEPTKIALELLWPRMDRGGSTIIIDDYNFAPTPGINKAVDEFFKDKGVHVNTNTHMTAFVRKWF